MLDDQDKPVRDCPTAGPRVLPRETLSIIAVAGVEPVLMIVTRIGQVGMRGSGRSGLSARQGTAIKSSEQAVANCVASLPSERGRKRENCRDQDD